MSRGRRAVVVRLPDGLIEDMEVAISERNARMKGEEQTVSDWIRQAIVEKLDKLRRGRGSKGGVIHPREYL